jgi:hypothetical protein
MSPYKIASILAGLSALTFAWMSWRTRRRIRAIRETYNTASGIAQEGMDAAVGDAINLRKQCDNLIVENARLRQVVGEKTEYAEELAAELAKATSSRRLGYEESLGIAAALLAGGAKFWSCGTEGHTKVEWRGNVAHCTDCGHSSADVVDEDVTRPYTDAFEAGDGR